ncbi:glycosyltransferase [Lactiplantibacillus plantarum]|nr:glycosyltransferase [Lactiplantibacillus plantarum]
MPKVSVLMATRNGHKYLKEAITSILCQSFSDFEFIICNDHSSDDTAKIIEHFRKNDNRIKVFENEFPDGFTSALNYGLEHCEGKYIARMDDDDISHPDRLAIEAEYLDQCPMISIVSSNVNFFDSSGIYGRTSKINLPTNKDIWRGKIFTHPAVMFRKKILSLVGQYSTSKDVTRIEDYDFWCKFYSYGLKGINLPNTLLDYREDHFSLKKRNAIRKVRLVKCMHKWRKRLNIPIYYDVFMVYELMKILVPQRLIGTYHRVHFKL